MECDGARDDDATSCPAALMRSGHGAIFIVLAFSGCQDLRDVRPIEKSGGRCSPASECMNRDEGQCLITALLSSAAGVGGTPASGLSASSAIGVGCRSSANSSTCSIQRTG